MALGELFIAGYRSIRRSRLKAQNVNVLVGPNGSGKTNFTKALALLDASAHGRLARTVAQEGGMSSLLWAGARRRGPVRLSLGFTHEHLRYHCACGVPRGRGLFDWDPIVSEERIDFLDEKRGTVNLVKRTNNSLWSRGDQGDVLAQPVALSESESILYTLRDPRRYPEILEIRQEMDDWRIYPPFRVDSEAPMRSPQVGVRTPVLSRDGRDLAAALQTIRSYGDANALDVAIDLAFPGAELIIDAPESYFSMALHFPQFLRPFDTRELSEGTLHYLCLLAVLLSPQPPRLLALNEPESGLHQELFEPVASLVARASQSTQIWITTCSETLADAIRQESGCQPVILEKIDGETVITGQPAPSVLEEEYEDV